MWRSAVATLDKSRLTKVRSKRNVQIDSFQPGVDREAAGGWVHARDVLHVVDVLLCQLGLAVPGVAMMELAEMIMMMMVVMLMLTSAHSPCAGG